MLLSAGFNCSLVIKLHCKGWSRSWGLPINCVTVNNSIVLHGTALSIIKKQEAPPFFFFFMKEEKNLKAPPPSSFKFLNPVLKAPTNLLLDVSYCTTSS